MGVHPGRWPRTTEAGAFWGIALGYALGLLWYLVMSDDIDPSYITTVVPLVVVPGVSLLTSERREGRDAFYRTIRTPPA